MMTATNERMAMAHQLADVIAGDLVGLVEEIERTPFPGTRNNYGEYMSIISETVEVVRNAFALKKTGAVTYLIVGLALVKAGANKQGVYDALKALGRA